MEKYSWLENDRGKCSSSVLDGDSGFQKLLQKYMDSWYSFIPRVENMLPEFRNPCWYSNISIPRQMSTDIDSWQSIIRRQNRIQTMKIVSEAIASQVEPVVQPELYCLFSFLEMGFAKSGSTSLYNLLGAHADVANQRIKECQFWRTLAFLPDSLNQRLQMILYTYHFQKATATIAKNQRAIAHEGSAWTVYAAPVSAREFPNHVCLVPVMISKVLPQSKFIVVMRNPVHRVWSNYWYDCRYHIDKPENSAMKENYIKYGAQIFHRLAVKSVRIFNDCIASGSSSFACADKTLQYKEDLCDRVQVGVSMYYIHLVKWYGVFPEDQILILRTEDLATNQLETVVKAWKFLGLREPLKNETEFVANMHYSNVNPFAHVKDGPEENEVDRTIQIEMLSQTYQLLADTFRPYNRKLAILLNDHRFTWEN